LVPKCLLAEVSGSPTSIAAGWPYLRQSLSSSIYCNVENHQTHNSVTRTYDNASKRRSNEAARKPSGSGRRRREYDTAHGTRRHLCDYTLQQRGLRRRRNATAHSAQYDLKPLTHWPEIDASFRHRSFSIARNSVYENKYEYTTDQELCTNDVSHAQHARGRFAIIHSY